MNGATEGRHPLLIGNSRYDDPGLDALGAPQEDVLRLREVLCEPGIGGFEARLALDLGTDEVRTAIVEFLAARRSDDFALVYYTGR